MALSARPHLRLINETIDLTPRREFDQLGRIERAGILAHRVPAREVPDLLSYAAGALPALAAAEETVGRIAERNQDSLWVFRKDLQPVGIYAMLHLSVSGLEALLLGELDTGAPDPCLTVATGETPAGIYKWAVVAPGPAASGICAMSRLMQTDCFARANLFARPATPEGCRLMQRLGFRSVRSGYPDLYRYIRIVNRGSGLVDGD